jgi:hypothetical protein
MLRILINILIYDRNKPVFYCNQKFTTVLTEARPFDPSSLRSILIIFSSLSKNLPNALFLSVFLTINIAYIVYCILASCYIRLTLNICSFVHQCNTFTS